MKFSLAPSHVASDMWLELRQDAGLGAFVIWINASVLSAAISEPLTQSLAATGVLSAVFFVAGVLVWVGVHRRRIWVMRFATGCFGLFFFTFFALAIAQILASIGFALLRWQAFGGWTLVKNLASGFFCLFMVWGILGSLYRRVRVAVDCLRAGRTWNLRST